MYIDDCMLGIDMIMHCDELIATPINLGSSELVSINTLVSMVEQIGGIKLERKYDLDAPRGVAGRNSDNTFIQAGAGLGAAHAVPAWPDQDLRVDRAAVFRSEVRQARRRRNLVRESLMGAPQPLGLAELAMTDLIGAIPYRMAFAGGWIDQPFVSRLNPTRPARW